ncbi:MAG TPA: indole-3-glycerol-phosphate synthase TrpC, partial [Candidatus Nanopelagicaceae bacterium]|nr:indole-3-glycerol-phosphate synthase TrpC [Candidatus Nanopelagicaceae bacterium]
MSVLDQIIAGVLEDLAIRQERTPLAEIRVLASKAPPAQDVRMTLSGPDVGVIAEVKRSSPSKGNLAEIADPAMLAAQYADGGAAVVSVLTETRRFGGSLQDLDAVRARIATPV